jgi:hypothetical protein
MVWRCKANLGLLRPQLNAAEGQLQFERHNLAAANHPTGLQCCATSASMYTLVDGGILVILGSGR